MCDGCQPAISSLLEGSGRRSRRELIRLAAALAVAGVALPAVAAAQPGGGPKGGRGADLIFHGGPIVTVNPRQPEVEALAVREGRIVALGRAAEVLALAERETRVIDLQGKALLPGFVDPHLHVVNTAAVRSYVDVTPFTNSSLSEVLMRLQQAVAAAQPGDWVAGFGYDPSLTPPFDQTLGFQNLNPLSATVPIFVLNLSGHLAYANAAAFALAGVTDQTPDPPGGGRYVKDANGQLTGVLAEPPAFDAFTAKLPPVAPQQLVAAVRETLWSFQQAGCTTVNDNGTGLNGIADFSLNFAFSAPPDAPVRLSCTPISTILAEITGYIQSPSSAPAGFPTGLVERITPSGSRVYATADGRFQMAAVKIWQDGSIQGLTAALRQPYLNSTSTGFPNYTQQELTAAVQVVHDAGWTCSIHTNGDAAVEVALNAYETVLAGSPRRDHRNRIEHCTMASADQLARIARLGLTPSFLINHVYYWGEAFRDRILGPARAERLDPAGEALRLGIPFSFHCDAFTTPCAPLSYIQTAVTRQMRTSGAVLGEQQRIPVDEAIKAVTLAPAYQLFLDQEIGSLEPGKRADFVVLGNDPRRVAPDMIGQIPVVETWLDGVKRVPPGT